MRALCAAVALAACGSSPAPKPPAPATPPAQPSARPEVADTATAEVTPRAFNASDVPEGATVEGKLVGGLRWTDRRGDNFVLFSQLERDHTTDQSQWGFSDEVTSVYLYATHFARSGGALRVVNEVRQADENCDADTATRFRTDTFRVTDLDHDGLGEATFGYFSEGCRTDVSPSVYKLYVLEDGETYGLRGQSHFPSMGDPPAKPSATIGSGEPPAAFRDHLAKLWPTTSSEE